MSWTRTLATGSGALEFRLQIEGYEHEWVTNSSMAGATSDTPARTRCVGLLRDGIVLDEQGDLRNGKLKLGSMSLKIADIDGRATLSFSRKPTKITWLRTTVSTSDTNVPVTSTDGWTTSDLLNFGTETADVTAVVDADDFTVTRAVWSTIAQKHWTEDGEHLRAPMVTNYPQMMEGRRARLYVYGGGDSMTGDGTLIWIGVVSTEPVLTDGVHWEITIDPITRLLQADIGEDLEEPVRPRGIYYPWNAPLYLILTHSTDEFVGFDGSTEPIMVTGFFETQADFCAALATALAAAATAASFSGTFSAAPSEDGWQIVYTTAGASPHYITVSGLSESDSFDAALAFGSRLADATGEPVNEVDADTTYYVPFFGTVPRGSWGDSGRLGYQADWGSREAFPEHRVYLGGAITVDSDMTGVQIEWADGTDAVHPVNDSGFDATERYVEIGRVPFGARPIGYVYTASTLPEMKFGREYGTGAFGGDFSDFLDSICTDAPNFANIGAVPFLTYADFDNGTTLATTAAVVTEAAAGRSFLTNRRYLAFGERSLEKWIAEECKILGIFPCLNSAGRMTFRRLKLPIATEIATGDVDSSATLMDGGVPAYVRNADGMVNTVIIRTGYDPVEDEHTGHTYKVRDITGFGINRSVRQDEFAPMSAALLGEDAITAEQIRSVAAPVLAIFGAPYSTISVDVPLTLFGVLLGDVVHIVNAHLPDPDDGTRGWSTAKAGLVVGRNWDMAIGRGTLTLLVHTQNVAGYAPQMRITADTINDPGTNLDHTLTVSGTDVDGTAAYIPSGTDATDWLAADYKVRALEWDAAVPTTAKGTVTAVTATTVRVTFNSATGSLVATTYMLGFDGANTGAYATGQKAFCSLAGTDGLVDYPSDAQAARVFGP